MCCIPHPIAWPSGCACCKSALTGCVAWQATEESSEEESDEDEEAAQVGSACFEFLFGMSRLISCTL